MYTSHASGSSQGVKRVTNRRWTALPQSHPQAYLRQWKLRVESLMEDAGARAPSSQSLRSRMHRLMKFAHWSMEIPHSVRPRAKRLPSKLHSSTDNPKKGSLGIRAHQQGSHNVEQDIRGHVDVSKTRGWVKGSRETKENHDSRGDVERTCFECIVAAVLALAFSRRRCQTSLLEGVSRASIMFK